MQISVSDTNVSDTFDLVKYGNIHRFDLSWHGLEKKEIVMTIFDAKNLNVIMWHQFKREI